MPTTQLKQPSNRVVRAVNFGGGYDGASQTTRATNWSARNVGPNAISSQAEEMRKRSRSLHRNNPLIRKGIDSLVTNEVGKGITPRFLDDTNRDTLNDYWKMVVKNADPEGILNLYGMQVQIATARRVSGEVFIRRRHRRHMGASTPIQFQVLEADFVPVSHNQDLSNGNIIRSGIEFNKRGERVAYWMHASHPLEMHGLSTAMDRNRGALRVRAADVIHHFMPTRPGQLRGEPNTAQAIVKAFTLDQYDDAELQRKETRAKFTGSIEKDHVPSDDDNGDEVESEPLSMVNGSMVELMPGEKINLFEGDITGSGYADFIKQQTLSLAAALNLPYELLTGDWSNVNDRLVRAILNEFRRGIEASVDHLMVFQVLQPMFEWSVKAGVLSGGLILPSFGRNYNEIVSCEWSGQEWPYVHPEQDIKARILEINAKLTSKTQSMLERNIDPEAVGKGLKEDAERAERYGYDDTTESTPAEAEGTEGEPDDGNDDNKDEDKNNG